MSRPPVQLGPPPSPGRHHQRAEGRSPFLALWAAWAAGCVCGVGASLRPSAPPLARCCRRGRPRGLGLFSPPPPHGGPPAKWRGLGLLSPPPERGLGLFSPPLVQVGWCWCAAFAGFRPRAPGGRAAGCCSCCPDLYVASTWCGLAAVAGWKASSSALAWYGRGLG